VKKTKLRIGRWTFHKAQAARRARAIRDSYFDGEPITYRNHDGFIRALFDRHPNRANKLGGSTIQDVFVELHGHRARRFYLALSDGSLIDFNYKRCLQ
jgi:Protein of unknown function (DUF3223)